MRVMRVLRRRRMTELFLVAFVDVSTRFKLAIAPLSMNLIDGLHGL